MAIFNPYWERPTAAAAVYSPNNFSLLDDTSDTATVATLTHEIGSYVDEMILSASAANLTPLSMVLTLKENQDGSGADVAVGFELSPGGSYDLPEGAYVTSVQVDRVQTEQKFGAPSAPAYLTGNYWA